MNPLLDAVERSMLFGSLYAMLAMALAHACGSSIGTGGESCLRIIGRRLQRRLRCIPTMTRAPRPSIAPTERPASPA